MKNFFKILSLTALILGLSFQTVFANQEMVEASGIYVIDLKADETFATCLARAREEAKRSAAEKAGVYVQTYSKVINLQLDYDEIKTVTAQILKVQDDEKVESKPLDGGLLEIKVTIKAFVDTSDTETLKTIMADKDSLANATERYKNLQQEYENLKNQMEELKKSYRSAKPSQQSKIKESIAQNNRYFEAFMALETGNSFYFNHDFQSAISEYSRAIGINPNFAEAYNNRGNSYVMMKNYDNAAQDYQNAIRCNKVEPRIYNNLGGIYLIQKNYSAAINEYTNAIKLNPNLAEAYYNRALSYYYLQQFQNALPDAKRAVELNPSDSDAKKLYNYLIKKVQ